MKFLSNSSILFSFTLCAHTILSKLVPIFVELLKLFSSVYFCYPFWMFSLSLFFRFSLAAARCAPCAPYLSEDSVWIGMASLAFASLMCCLGTI